LTPGRATAECVTEALQTIAAGGAGVAEPGAGLDEARHLARQLGQAAAGIERREAGLHAAIPERYGLK
jgi:hypothetical protein